MFCIVSLRVSSRGQFTRDLEGPMSDHLAA